MPIRDGTGPFGDGRPGKGLGNCANSRKTNPVSGRGKNRNVRGTAINGVSILADAIKYLLDKKPRNKR